MARKMLSKYSLMHFQIDQRYQKFIARAAILSVLGYEMKVAIIEDVLQRIFPRFAESQ
jgi:hypothetical protein